MTGEHDLFTPQRQYANTMIPADAGIDLKELVRIALLNIDLFDRIAMDGESERVGNSTVALSHLKTYRAKFEEGLVRIAAKQGWSPEACQAVKALKKKCPPDRLYRVKGGFHSATRGLSPLAVVVSYRPGQRGGSAEVGMAVLGFSNDMLGSAAQPMGVPAEGLEDVTEAARKGSLDELRGTQR